MGLIDSTKEMADKREEWRKFLLRDWHKGAASVDEAFAAGWNAALVVQLEPLMEDIPTWCPECGHMHIVTVPLVTIKSKIVGVNET